MKFRAVRHSSKQGAKHGRPIPHGRKLIPQPHRQGVNTMESADPDTLEPLQEPEFGDSPSLGPDEIG